MKFAIILLIAFVCVLHKSCKENLEGDPYHHFWIINNSDDNIYINYGLGVDYMWLGFRETDFFPPYPDTAMIGFMPTKEFRLVVSKDTGGFVDDITIENVFKNRLPSDTLSIYFFHADTLRNHSWETIRDEYMILKRYDLSLEDIKSLDKSDRGRPQRTITYPPSSEMEGMRMYPR
jgi:hypothetical protein